MSESNPICDDHMTFNECELAILRHAVDKAEELQGEKIVSSPEIQQIIKIAENFIQTKQLICYGGTAINNILPKRDQFYDMNSEIPDYDFFSPNALSHAKELATIYAKRGFVEVEAKSGVHYGTFKVFVNFIPVADITQLHPILFNELKKDAIHMGGILYAPPNFLRMSMYLELSRPSGDVSRWEKILKRLILLNKNYPLTNQACQNLEFQRNMSAKMNDVEVSKIYEDIRDVCIDQGCVFFGGYALSLYAQYMPKQLQVQLKQYPDFDVLTEDPQTVLEMIRLRLREHQIKRVTVIKHPGLGELVKDHYEVKIGADTVAFLYTPVACHSYNIVHKNNREVKIATIDTMLSFYLAFIYLKRPYYDSYRILCLAKFLFEVQARNRLSQRGLLKRFSMQCIGHQETLEEIRSMKSEKFKELKRGSKEWEMWFLNYKPTVLVKQNVDANDKKLMKTTKRRKNGKQGQKKTKKWFGLYKISE